MAELGVYWKNVDKIKIWIWIKRVEWINIFLYPTLKALKRRRAGPFKWVFTCIYHMKCWFLNECYEFSCNKRNWRSDNEMFWDIFLSGSGLCEFMEIAWLNHKTLLCYLHLAASFSEAQWMNGFVFSIRKAVNCRKTGTLVIETYLAVNKSFFVPQNIWQCVLQ